MPVQCQTYPRLTTLHTDHFVGYLVTAISDEVGQLFGLFRARSTDGRYAGELSEYDGSWLVDVEPGRGNSGAQVQHTDRCPLEVESGTALLQ